MKRLLLGVAALLVLAGCTALPAGDGASGQPPAQGLIIQEARLGNTLIPQDGSTELVLRVANTQGGAAEDVDIDIRNSGEIELTLDSGKSDSICPAVVDDGGDPAVQGAVQGVPTELLCVWNVRAASDGERASTGTYPITVAISYTNTLTMQQESPKIRFDPEQQVPAAATARTYGNGEVSLTVSFPPALPADTDDVTIDADVRNVGDGRLEALDPALVPEGGTCGERCAVLSLDGSLLEDFQFPAPSDDVSNPATRCRLIRFIEGERSATTTCRLVPSRDISGQRITHNVRGTITYRYMRQAETPLKVVED